MIQKNTSEEINMRGGEADAVDKCGTQAGTEETTYPSTQTTPSYFQIRHVKRSKCKYKLENQYVYKDTQYIQINVTLIGKEETTYPTT